MQTRLLAAALGAVAFAGCGGEARPPAEPALQVWVDPALRAVLDGQDVTATVAPSDVLLKRLSQGRRPDVLLVQSATFPSWDENLDRLRDSRVVAHDALVLVTAKGAPPVALNDTGGGTIALPSEGAAGALVRSALERLPRSRRPEHQLELQTSTDVLAALRAGNANVGVVLRSELRRARDRKAFQSAELFQTSVPALDVQTAYAEGSPAGAKLVRWLASGEARKRFAAAGYGPPGANPRPVDCPADPAAACKERSTP